MIRRAAVPALVALAVAGCGSSGGGAPPAATVAAPGAAQVANGPAPGRPLPVHVAPSHQAVPILMYHVIGTPRPGTPLPGLWVTAEAFRAQVAALAAAGFQGVTLDTVLDAWSGRARLPPHPVVLSFDDGYLGQGTVAGPVLAARRWPGVINVVLKNVGIPGGISGTRLRQLKAQGWEIDAHTLTHRDLTTLGPDDLRREIAGSRAELRRRFAAAVDAFCYPAGRFDATVEAAVRAAGYRAATTEINGAARPGDDRFALPRVRVDGGDSAATVVARARAVLVDRLGSGT